MILLRAFKHRFARLVVPIGSGVRDIGQNLPPPPPPPRWARSDEYHGLATECDMVIMATEYMATECTMV